VRALRCVQLEEQQRLARFRYREDALLSLVGRLLLRYAAATLTPLAPRDIHFCRTDRGRPELCPETQARLPKTAAPVSMNVSHSVRRWGAHAASWAPRRLQGADTAWPWVEYRATTPCWQQTEAVWWASTWLTCGSRSARTLPASFTSWPTSSRRGNGAPSGPTSPAKRICW
jgi:hypothetical protein